MWSKEDRVTVNGIQYTPMYHSIVMDHVTTYLHNTNGNPKEQLDQNNTIQEIAEGARLGIPVVLSTDRSYNTWGGMIDMPHYAVGIAHDEELLYKLVSQYAKELYALGYHVPFHTYGVEIGSWYGDDVKGNIRQNIIAHGQEDGVGTEHQGPGKGAAPAEASAEKHVQHDAPHHQAERCRDLVIDQAVVSLIIKAGHSMHQRQQERVSPHICDGAFS